MQSNLESLKLQRDQKMRQCHLNILSISIKEFIKVAVSNVSIANRLVNMCFISGQEQTKLCILM